MMTDKNGGVSVIYGKIEGCRALDLEKGRFQYFLRRMIKTERAYKEEMGVGINAINLNELSFQERLRIKHVPFGTIVEVYKIEEGYYFYVKNTYEGFTI